MVDPLARGKSTVTGFSDRARTVSANSCSRPGDPSAQSGWGGAGVGEGPVAQRRPFPEAEDEVGGEGHHGVQLHRPDASYQV